MANWPWLSGMMRVPGHGPGSGADLPRAKCRQQSAGWVIVYDWCERSQTSRGAGRPAALLANLQNRHVLSPNFLPNIKSGTSAAAE